MSDKLQAPRGTFDVLPEQAALRLAVEQAARRILESAGYRRIETPAFEATELFKRTVGESTDIVQFGFGETITLKSSFLDRLVVNPTKDVGATYGGAVAQPAYRTRSGFIEVVVDPTDIRALLREAPTPTLGEAVAHELIGHALGYLRDPRIDPNRTNRRAVDAENEARRRGGPQRGTRTTHSGGFPR